MKKKRKSKERFWRGCKEGDGRLKWRDTKKAPEEKNRRLKDYQRESWVQFAWVRIGRLRLRRLRIKKYEQ